MKKNKQILVDGENGDCMRACLTTMLDLPNDPNKIPVGGANDFFPKAYKFLGKFGLFINYEQKACWRHGYWMASVKSKNYPGGWHAIVMNSSKVAWDPSTKKKYRVGQSLLGEDVVRGGYYLEVVDASKLKNLAIFQKACAKGK
jgi:hypothetical protein